MAKHVPGPESEEKSGKKVFFTMTGFFLAGGFSNSNTRVMEMRTLTHIPPNYLIFNALSNKLLFVEWE